MRKQSVTSSGLTLVEFLIVIAILAILMGLLLPAISNIRWAANRTKATNQLRQISIATHNYINANAGKMPVAADPRQTGSFHHLLLPYIEARYAETYLDGKTRVVALYKSPIDPSYEIYQETHHSKGNCSFAANAWIFYKGAKNEHIGDGTSNTISLTERYARCHGTDVNWSLKEARCEGSRGEPVPCPSNVPLRMATLADRTFGDVIPISQNSKTLGSIAELTFQVAPHPNDCDPRIVQSASSSGLMTAFADGSVRTIRPGISSEIFWSGITSNGRESVSID